jgi:threonine/homoserine/homoserine lactone efflux protein
MPVPTTPFLVASLVLAITPGPGVTYLVTRTLAQGRAAGLASVAGVALGNLGNALAASLGLAAVFAASTAAFTAVKLAGAAYLIALGLRAWLAKTPGASVPVAGAAPARLFRDGFLVALLNPKTALFFAALLPQFMNAKGSALGQSTLLAVIFVSMAMCTDTAYVLATAALASTLRRRSSDWAQSPWRRHARYLSGASFLGLGVYAALVDRPER